MKKIMMESSILDTAFDDATSLYAAQNEFKQDSVVFSSPIGNLDLDQEITINDIRELEELLEVEFGEKIVLRIIEEPDTGF